MKRFKRGKELGSLRNLMESPEGLRVRFTLSHLPSLKLQGLAQNIKVEDRVLGNIFLQDKEGVQRKRIKN